MSEHLLQFTLLSNAIFGRGDGVAGDVDIEIQHDELGCPFLSGKEIKGILVEECADILAVLPDESENKKQLEQAACALFGRPGSLLEDRAKVHISDAELPSDLRDALYEERLRFLDYSLKGALRLDEQKIKEKSNLFRMQVLNSLTSQRTQTAMDESGVPLEHSLRTSRVILRNNIFVSRVMFSGMNKEEEDISLALLSACVKAFRRAGNSRNRGFGRVSAALFDLQSQNLEERYFPQFEALYLMKEGA